MKDNKQTLTTAVALKYDECEAPRITATGEGALAEEIIRIATESNIPLYENADLVGLLSKLELGEQIPEVLYRVIAEIIAFAYYLQGKTPKHFGENESESDDHRQEKPIN